VTLGEKNQGHRRRPLPHASSVDTSDQHRRLGNCFSTHCLNTRCRGGPRSGSVRMVTGREYTDQGTCHGHFSSDRHRGPGSRS